MKATDDRLAVRWIYEESWKYAYKDVILQAYLDRIPAGRWSGKGFGTSPYGSWRRTTARGASMRRIASAPAGTLRRTISEGSF